jgi:hypothetical protein
MELAQHIAQHIIETEVKRILNSNRYSVFSYNSISNIYLEKGAYLLEISPTNQKNYTNAYHYNSNMLPWPIGEAVGNVPPSFIKIPIRHEALKNPSIICIKNSLYHNKFHELFLGDPEFTQKFEKIIVAGLEERLANPIGAGFGVDILPYMILASNQQYILKFNALWNLAIKLNNELPTKLSVIKRSNILRLTIKKSKATIEIANLKLLSKSSLKSNIFIGNKRVKRTAQLSSRRDIKNILSLIKRAVLLSLGIDDGR